MKLVSKLWLCLPLLLFLSCSNTRQTTSSSVKAQSYRSELVKNNAPEDPATARFIVPPELGVVSGTISSIANSFAEVAELLATNSDKLEKNISQAKGCSFEIVDYQHPTTVNSGKSIISSTERHFGSLEFEILISLAEIDNIKGRIQQINSCLQAIPTLKLKPAQKDKDIIINLSLSKVLPTVKDAGKYRQKLLEFKSQPFKEVANLLNPAVQFDAADTKCTSKGIVTVVNRNLSGIELDVDFDCRRLVDEQQIPEN